MFNSKDFGRAKWITIAMSFIAVALCFVYHNDTLGQFAFALLPVTLLEMAAENIFKRIENRWKKFVVLKNEG